jgi:hypothetical protein
MADLGRLVFPFTSTPTNYGESLQKLAAVLCYELMLVQIILYHNTALGSVVDNLSLLLGLDHIVTALDPNYSSTIARPFFALIIGRSNCSIRKLDSLARHNI